MLALHHPHPLPSSLFSTLAGRNSHWTRSSPFAIFDIVGRHRRRARPPPHSPSIILAFLTLRHTCLSALWSVATLARARHNPPVAILAGRHQGGKKPQHRAPVAMLAILALSCLARTKFICVASVTVVLVVQ